MRIDWRTFATTKEQIFPVWTSHFSRPTGDPLCSSDLCYQCSILRREWRWDAERRRKSVHAFYDQGNREVDKFTDTPIKASDLQDLRARLDAGEILYIRSAGEPRNYGDPVYGESTVEVPR